MTDLEALGRRYSGHQPGLLGARHSYAVLCPLVEQGGALHLLFEVRAAGLRQEGEVCFPGGRKEPGETAEQCALRETWEELAIPPEQVTVLGTPDFICNQAGFLLQPVLGLVSAAGFHDLRPSPAEVAEVFTVPLDFFRRTAPEVYAYDLIPSGAGGFPLRPRGHPHQLRLGPRPGGGAGVVLAGSRHLGHDRPAGPGPGVNTGGS